MWFLSVSTGDDHFIFLISEGPIDSVLYAHCEPEAWLHFTKRYKKNTLVYKENEKEQHNNLSVARKTRFSGLFSGNGGVSSLGVGPVGV